VPSLCSLYVPCERRASSAALQLGWERLETYHPGWDPWPVLVMFRLYVWGLSIRASVSHPLEYTELVERQGKPERGVVKRQVVNSRARSNGFLLFPLKIASICDDFTSFAV
jgi:hypothetical protein